MNMEIRQGNTELPKEWLEKKKLSPNRGRWNGHTKTLTLVVRQSPRGDFALSCGLRELAKLMDDGTVANINVELIDGGGNVVAQKPAREVLKGLEGVSSQSAAYDVWGPYWWIAEDFRDPRTVGENPNF
jgi:hypothetical protein